MNLARVDQIAKAVLYEGYMLYPYRPSSVKNQQRWNFGVVYPQAYSDHLEGAEICSMRTECLVGGDANSIVEGRLRFLQLQTRTTRSSSEPQMLPDCRQEAIEREVVLPEFTLEELGTQPQTCGFAFPPQTQLDLASGEGRGIVERRLESVEGSIEISAVTIDSDVFKVCLHVQNTSPMGTSSASRDTTLMYSLVSAHTILGVKGGEFISLLDPPEGLQQATKSCENVGAWPVLVGDPGDRDTLLASPIILYDYPQIAPESPGDLFDGTEIDEILSLRIMTLTDEEKREIRQSDERVRQILERTESMPAEQFMKLHGAVRGLRPLKEDRQ